MSSKVVKLVVLMSALLAITPTLATPKEDASSSVILSDDNTLVLDTEVSGESVAPLILKVRKLNKKSRFSDGFSAKKPIYLFLNTPGGDIQAGLELIEALKGSERPIHTIILFAASMGFQITQGLGERHILSMGILMSHRARGQIQGEFGGQSPSQMDSRYGIWLRRITEMDEQTVKRTKGKQTLESYQKSYVPELWMTGSESVKGGYADNVVTVKCDESLDGTTSHEARLMGIIPVTYELDNCPINTAPLNIKVNIPVAYRQGGKTVPVSKGESMELDAFTSSGGAFGPACLYTTSDGVCAADPGLTLDRVKMAVEELKHRIVSKKDYIVYMTAK